MELKEFMQNNLPNYKERREKAHALARKLGINAQEVVDLMFHVKNHNEALQNFADKICEKQKENCVAAAVKSILKNGGKFTRYHAQA